jgi:hypothetical protein
MVNPVAIQALSLKNEHAKISAQTQVIVVLTVLSGGSAEALITSGKSQIIKKYPRFLHQ